MYWTSESWINCLVVPDSSMGMRSPVNSVHDNLISNLDSTFSESLHIQDAQKTECASKENDICDVAKKNSFQGFKQQGRKPNKKYLKKSATFPVPEKKLPSSSSDEEAETSFTESLSKHSANKKCPRSLSLPAPSTIISAMKGSREKHGGQLMKLTVKWDPDVYDPTPTLMSHTVKNKKPQKSKRKKKNEKKNGKKGQKGNSSQGGNGKDKKQCHKLGGTSDLCYKSSDSPNEVNEASTEIDDLDVRIEDSYCGTSFLKESVTELHYSVAEAQ
ncbi:PREDICTED: uncharacterized protein LOC109348417 isoform X1 [Lupinus angustifolius]|uniref:uncharacterized protein LOC109348417 isoform X1 n=2 Tax=Lupinus angustifolius TaxID=3871 RepID=UPI00092E89E0|nr:PREDICTED: uncharacterized protein LOC109348417 isoform X1 [Lupinus angustifolius]